MTRTGTGPFHAAGTLSRPDSNTFRVNDLGLLDRARRGDESAFAELFERHRAAVFRYALHMCGRTGAEDVVQEVFLAFLRQLDRYEPDRGTVQAYLLGIGRRQALRSLTGRQREGWPEQSWDGAANPPDTAAVPDPVIDPFLASSSTEIVARVRKAIAMLPPVYREAIALCDLNELDYATAASVMGCPIGTVRSRLSRARSMLTAGLSELKPKDKVVANVG